MGRTLAIDYGRKRVGIAVSDTLGMIANPIGTVTPEELLPFLKNYILAEKVSTVVIGDPRNLDNTPGDLSSEIESLVARIRKTHPDIGVHLFDERFTSKMAAQTLVEAGYTRKARQRKDNLDKVSATILLQNYIDSLK